MKKTTSLTFILFLTFCFLAKAQNFSMEQVGKFSFPSELTSSPSGEKIAWAMNEQGKRNVYFAEGPDFKPTKLTSFNEDDGQEISSLRFTPDGNWLVFVRGGDHGGGNASSTVNAQNLPKLPKVEIWKINLQTKATAVVTEGDDFFLGAGQQLVFLKNGQVWKA
ncbi:MAG TPA: peptidase S9, partial [Algoriphagus sp.]|nr:peptidase S9 [Algoriphagus sp.]